MEAFDAYKAKRKASVDPINEVFSLGVCDAFGSDVIHQHAATCLHWAEELTECYVGDLERRQSNNIKRYFHNCIFLLCFNHVFRVQSRFKRLGYHPEDVTKATLEIAPHVNSISRPRLSNKRESCSSRQPSTFSTSRQNGKLSDLVLSLLSSEFKKNVGHGNAGSSSTNGKNLCTSCIGNTRSQCHR